MTVVRYHERKEAIQYTGANSAAIDALIVNFNIVSEGAGVLTAESGGPNWVININDWVCWQQGYVVEIRTPAEFAYLFTELAMASELAALDARVDAAEAEIDALETAQDATDTLVGVIQAELALLGSTAMLSVGAAAVPTLLAGAQVTVPVGMYPSLPSSSFTPHTQLFGGINLGPLQVLSATPTSTSNVDVVVRNNGLLSLTGATLLVAAVS